MNNINDEQLIYRVVVMFLGVLLIGIGIAFLRGSEFGTDPFTAMNLGISKMRGISLGVFQLEVNIILFIIVFLLGRKYIGLGMITNMVLVGFISDVFSTIISSGYTMEIRILFTVLGIIITCLGVAIYSSVNLGISPYDAIGWIVEDMTKHKLNFKISRIVTDIICIVIGISFGSIISINTIIMAFFTGPLVQFFTQKIIKLKLVSKNYN